MAHQSEGPIAKGRPLTEKQRRFVEAYMGAAAGNATEAARLAGYSGGDNALAVAGSQNLRNPKIAEAIEERRAADPLVMTREQAMARLSAIGSGSRVVPYVIDGVIAADPAQPERDLLLPAKVGDQLKAIDTLARICGWDRHEDSGNDKLAAFLGALAGARQ